MQVLFLIKEQDGGFLAGVVAALMTKTKSVSVLAGNPVSSDLRYSNGFLQGVRQVCQDCTVFRDFTRNYDSLYLYQESFKSFIDSLLELNSTSLIDVLFTVPGVVGKLPP